MSTAYTHNGKVIVDGGYSESGEYRATSVNGKWYYHPADNDWLAFNANEDFSEPFDAEAEAIEAANEFEAE